MRNRRPQTLKPKPRIPENDFAWASGWAIFTSLFYRPFVSRKRADSGGNCRFTTIFPFAEKRGKCSKFSLWVYHYGYLDNNIS